MQVGLWNPKICRFLSLLCVGHTFGNEESCDKPELTKRQEFSWRCYRKPIAPLMEQPGSAEICSLVTAIGPEATAWSCVRQGQVGLGKGSASERGGQ